MFTIHSRSCNTWAAVVKDPYAKTEWLLARSGKTRALFVAVKLGPNFLNIPVLYVKIYLQERSSFRDTSFKVKNQSPWARNLSLPVFLYLSNKGCNQLGNAVPLKGNDMELLHFLSAGPHFISFPPRPKSIQQPLPEEYPPKDGYENQICDDLNDLVLRGALIILFPSAPSSDWVCPTVSNVISRYN
ncbi:4070_t:CDS:2 [Funneliformis mosseae]|uniref:4070_t:CDS:1 n=1 Tax=Funneliformis mosseae TaxID=27381 RepID=A0A9N9FQR9_FUNMO|nr:4070_t:CDS:2 [Funneliformis mosseae]